MSDLVQRLLHRNQAVRDEALAEAVSERHDHALGEALQRATGWRRVEFAAALGDLRRPGPSDELLREASATSGPGTRDLRCAAMIALVKRLDVAATRDLRLALAQKDSAVRECAIFGLAAVGDQTAWDDVLGWLRKRKPASHLVIPSPSRAAAHYLLRHLPERSADDLGRLVGVLRDKRPVLQSERASDWLTSIWPDIETDRAESVAPPSSLDPDEWRHQRLFASSAVAR